MSFSKARIQRFNECENKVPPPGAYDPKFEVKVKGIVIEKSDRFHDNKSVASAEYNVSVSTKSTCNVAASFRTPQLPRKKVSPRTCSKAKPRALVPVNVKKLKYKSEHELADLQAECKNKDKTIQEHEKLIEDMKVEARKLELQLEDLLRKQTETEEQHKKDIETMAKLQQDVLNGHTEKHQLEIENFRRKLLEMSEEKERDTEARKEIEEALKKRIAEFSGRTVDLESELNSRNHRSEEKVQSLVVKMDELLMHFDELSERHRCEISSLEHDKTELNAFISHLTEEIGEYEDRLKRTVAESDEKMSTMIKETKAAAEEEMKLTLERYKACLARVETERTALDENLVQKDDEIARLTVILEELKSSAETQESFSQSLQMELDRAETELAGKKEELRALKDQIRSEAAEMVSRRKRFEVVMAENQASVAALTKRLAQSNAEVERLQRELKRGEDCINEHRDLLSIMRNNSQMVHVQVHTLMEQLDAKKGLVNQLEAESLSEVESIRTIFEAKFEDLRKIVTNEVMKLQTDCDEKDAKNIEMKNQLEEMAGHLNEAQTMLVKLEERCDAQELEISRVELLNIKLNDHLKANKAAMEKTTKLLETQSAKQIIALNETNAKKELRDKIKGLEEKNSIMQDKTELFEEEKASREAADMKIKVLLEYNERLAKDYQEISDKYAELIGHQNHKQRIKHVSHLKDKINQLKQELHVKIKITEQQQKIIEKLRTEEKRAHSKGKENMLGIPKSDHATPVSSPHKPLTPLRDRND
ncbi:hyaluronan mediated motility receptor-like [Colletes gigas]|uniref:hyaluronan mediated motility receptor-like n=1 Tax=Colletes gigas TaxID=935657 RepID=UPI001C9A4B68|nr:hyaluronan mediated motility receptor-like [Colletes gigas]